MESRVALRQPILPQRVYTSSIHAHAAERDFPKQESPICQAQGSASWTPEKHIDLVWDDSSPLLMLRTQFSNHCPGQLVKPKKRRRRLYWEPFCSLQTAGRCFTGRASLIYDTCCRVGAYLLNCFDLSFFFLVCIWFVSMYTLLISCGRF